MTKPVLVNVLADRYASPAMVALWTDEARVIRERRFWLAVLRLQMKAGYDAPTGAISAYERVLERVDLDSIRARERRTGHDVMARIEEFNALAGFDCIHVGLTSRDVTENTEQCAQLEALKLIATAYRHVLQGFAEHARTHRSLAIVGRSHNVPAQITTLGKRFASAAEELLLALESLDTFIATYPIRGIKGPMGTAADQSQLLGSGAAAASLDAEIAAELGADHVFSSTGQVYPRSLDLAAADHLIRLAAPLASLATTIRLMAGTGQASEGFAKGRVGSSAMPHKMNASRSERIAGLYAVLGGSHAQLAAITGSQWYEGDVTCSVVRRVAIPNAFLAADGLAQTALAVLAGFEAYPAVIGREIDTYLPFLATTRMLVAAVKAGLGRDEAHAIIKEHALATARAMREAGSGENDLVARLAADASFPLDDPALKDILASEPIEFAGRAREQTDEVIKRAQSYLKHHPPGHYEGAAVL